MKIERPLLRKIIEGALLAADAPMNLAKLAKLFEQPEGEVDPEYLYEKPATAEIMEVLEEIQADCQGRGYELKQVASGWRFQVVEEVAPWINRMWEEKPQRYSRALLETLALIAYRQPITRGDIEAIRGVAVSSTIIKTLTEREWIKVVGHRDVPGRPALYATTRQFLDYFNLKSLDELPSLKEIQDFDKLDAELDLVANAEAGEKEPSASGEEVSASTEEQPVASEVMDEKQLEADAPAELQADQEDDDLRLDEPFEPLEGTPLAADHPAEESIPEEDAVLEEDD